MLKRLTDCQVTVIKQGFSYLQPCDFSLVAERLTKMGKHTVNLDGTTADVKVVPFTVGMGVKFEVFN